MSKAAAGSVGRSWGCAVYTRKSSEEGLEQEFNSLHAQREACEAYIKSQRHEGWIALPQAYDDGGASGGTLERPALRRLLTDIQSGKVNVVVCYKLDRLTRSLADFVKIVEIFDAQDVSFVSVTQQFNTTTSMGRLTLNVLLSFAQFEREVIGERIRDKIAASKKKGMWMGGMPPLGYRCEDHKLIVVPSEAETVQHIYSRYAVLGSVRLLQRELETAGVRSKCWTSTEGRSWGGKPLGRGALYRMLENRIHRGEIVHKDQCYPGEHEPIIDASLWDEVQAKLAANAVERSAGTGMVEPSLLVGLLYDCDGHRMSPSHAVKKGVRYRYYVSQPLITKTRDTTPDGMRVAAAEIERVVLSGIAELLSDPGRLAEALGPLVRTARQQQRLLGHAAEIGLNAPTTKLRATIALLVRRVTVLAERIDIVLSSTGFRAFLSGETSTITSDEEGAIEVSLPVRLTRIGQGKRLLIDARRTPGQAASPDPTLIKLLVRAHHLRDRLRKQPGKPIAALAPQEKLSPSYIAMLMRLTLLAPVITRAILEGRHHAGFTTQKLIANAALPLAWSEQRVALGFA